MQIACIACILGLRRLLLALADAIVPAALPLYEMTTGVAQTQVVAAFVGLNLPQALRAGPLTLTALAEQTGAQAEMLGRFLRASQALGLVHRRRDGRFQASRLTQGLDVKRLGNMAAFATYMASGSNVAAWGRLTGVVRTGRDAFRQVDGANVWAWLRAHPDEEATFAAAMTSLAAMDAPSIARAYPFGRHRLVCDVGGGRGALVSAILAEHSRVQGLVVDQESVIVGADTALAPCVASRLRFVAGDFFHTLPADCDAYLLRHILHDWDDASCARILRRCREAMHADARLLIVDSQVEPDDSAFLGAIKDLTMGVVCGGQERGAAAMRALLNAAGLQLVRIWATGAPVVLWEAKRRDMGGQSAGEHEAALRASQPS